MPPEVGERPVSIRSMVDFPQPEGPSSAIICPGINARSVGRNDLDALSVRLRIKFFQLARFNNGLDTPLLVVLIMPCIIA